MKNEKKKAVEERIRVSCFFYLFIPYSELIPSEFKVDR